VILEKVKTILRMELKNLLNTGKSVLKLEDIMWESECVQL